MKWISTGPQYSHLYDSIAVSVTASEKMILNERVRGSSSDSA